MEVIPPQIAPELAVKAVQYRIWHTKTGGSSYLSQLELQAILDRALRRADLPMAFSQGFHPMPLMSFGRALPVGMESRAEWFAITLRTPMAAAEVHTRLASALPTGMAVIRVEEVDKSRRTEQSVAETFRLRTGSIDGEGLSLAAVAFGKILLVDGLLLHSDGTILDIAIQAGFESQRTFNRVFQERFHMAPREYRKSV